MENSEEREIDRSLGFSSFLGEAVSRHLLENYRSDERVCLRPIVGRLGSTTQRDVLIPSYSASSIRRYRERDICLQKKERKEARKQTWISWTEVERTLLISEPLEWICRLVSECAAQDTPMAGRYV